MRETGLSPDQLDRMDGADFGALAADLKAAPPLHQWLPVALAQLVSLWGGGKRIDAIMQAWGFRTPAEDMDEKDAAFIRAIGG